MAYELPDWVGWDPLFQVHLVPLQLLRVVMDQVLAADSPNTTGRETRVCLRTPLASLVDKSWLPDLNRWLPGSWAEGAIADKAVKDDGALINVLPWHRRITLLFPCRESNLAGVTMLPMRRWRRNIIRSFFRYLSRRCGRLWCTLLGSKRSRDERGSPEACGIKGVPVVKPIWRILGRS